MSASSLTGSAILLDREQARPAARIVIRRGTACPEVIRSAAGNRAKHQAPSPGPASLTPPPPPPGGEGSVCDIRGKAVPGGGVDAGFSGEGGEVRVQTQFLPGR